MDWLVYLRAMALAIALAAVGRADAVPGWRFWDTSDGLTESYTTRTVQAENGLWLEHGDVSMNFLDGYRFTRSTRAYAVGHVVGLPDGVLWMWTGSALKRFQSGVWREFRVPEISRLGTMSIDPGHGWHFVSKQRPELSARIGLAPLSAERVLILLPDRILAFSTTRPSSVETVLRSDQTHLERFLEIHPGRNGGLWVTGRHGIGRLFAKGKAGWQWSAFVPSPTGFDDYEEFMEGFDGDLFLTGRSPQGNGIVHFSGGEWRRIYSTSSAVLRAWPGAAGSVWIEDGNQLRQQCGGRIVERTTPLTGIPLAGGIEKDGKFWIGTSQGVARYSPPLWQTPFEARPFNDLVNAIAEDRQGVLWFSSATGLIRFDGSAWKKFPFPDGQQAWAVYTQSLVILPDGRVVLRSTKESPLALDPNTGKYQVIKHPEGRDIRLVVAHPAGMLLQSCRATDRSRCRFEVYDGRKFRAITPEAKAEAPVQGADDLRTVLLDRAGEFWVGGMAGLALFRDGHFERHGKEQGYTDNSAFLIYESPTGVAPPTGTLYAGGRDTLFVRKREAWRPILGSLDRTRSVLAARDGTLWVASGGGVHRYRNGVWVTHGAQEGLPSGVVYRVFEDSRGRIWAGTTQGLAIFDPKADTDPPVTLLSEAENSRQVPPGSTARLVFSGLDKWKETPSERLLFSWRIDNGPWSTFLPDRSASLENLPTGTRLFEVRAMDRNGNIDPHPARFEFAILPPWYQNPAFQVIAVISSFLTATLLVFATLSYRQRGELISELHRKKRLEADRQAILEMVARRKPLGVIFQRIARSIAVNCPGTQAGVIRLSGTSLQMPAESALPGSFQRDIEAISAVDTGFDALWTRLQEVGVRYFPQGCHFSPIRSGGDELLGAIAVCRRAHANKPGANMPIDVPIVSAMSNLAGAAIDSSRLYERLAHQAEHDALTGLPNRLMFEARLQDSLRRARESRSRVAVFFLDLDRFKQINDTLGHRVGDLFLKQVAARLAGSLAAHAMLARIGGDEFTVILDPVGTPDVDEVAQKMLSALRRPFNVEDHTLFASASIGVSLFPRDGQDHVTLQMHADQAMYRAKLTGKNRYEVFSPEILAASTIIDEMETVLRAALDQDRFMLYYQPQFTMDGELTGLEALLRMEYPGLAGNFSEGRGIVTPERFLDVAEETGLIARIDEWVMREVRDQIVRWRRIGLRVPRIGINVSEQRFRCPDFADQVSRLVAELNLGRDRLELELKEAAILNHGSEAAGQVAELRACGARIVVDHFGAGYSSLTYLHRLPVNALSGIKIDKSFVAGLDAPVSTLPLVRAIIEVSRDLRLDTVAMGIERPRQLQLLRGVHTGSAQGYLFGEPRPAGEMEELLRCGVWSAATPAIPAGVAVG